MYYSIALHCTAVSRWIDIYDPRTRSTRSYIGGTLSSAVRSVMQTICRECKRTDTAAVVPRPKYGTVRTGRSTTSSAYRCCCVGPDGVRSFVPPTTRRIRRCNKWCACALDFRLLAGWAVAGRSSNPACDCGVIFASYLRAVRRKSDPGLVLTSCAPRTADWPRPTTTMLVVPVAVVTDRKPVAMQS